MQHGAQQLSGFFVVLFAILQNSLLSVLTPTTLTDGLGNRRLVDALPALDAVCTTGVGQPLAWLLALLVIVMRKQDVAGGEIGGVQIEDVYRKLPVQHYEASHFRPGRVNDE